MATTKRLATSKFGVETAKQFVDSFSNIENDYFMYFGKHVPYGVPFAYDDVTTVVVFDASDDIASDSESIIVDNTTFRVGDRIRYYTDTGITPITGLSNNSIYYIIASSDGRVKLGANATTTAAVSVTPKTSPEKHYLSYASGAAIVRSTDDTVAAPTEADITTTTQAYDDMIFAKRIKSTDVSLMIDNNVWTTGEVYTQYDHKDANLFLKKFFVVVDDITEYNVYKCLYNNNDAPSTQQPARSGNSLDFMPIEMSDGYVWKFMFTITKFDHERFATSTFVPCTPNNHVIASATPGTVDVVKILNGGQGYNNWYGGSFQATDIRYLGSQLIYALGDDASSIDGFYENCVIKITSSQTPGAVGQYRKVMSYVGNVSGANKKYIAIDSAFSVSPTAGDTYEIYPAVTIWGDGSETIEASARAIINSTSSNSIHKIEILDSGQGYRVARGSLVLPSVIRSGTGFKDAVIEPIVSPPRGHGSDPFTELNARRVGVSVTVENTESGALPANNDFRSVGIIKNPQFTNVLITHNAAVGTFTIGEEIVQYKNIKLYGTMETIAGSNAVFKTGNGQLSSTITRAANGTGYDYTLNNRLVFDNTNTGGSGAEATFISNTQAVTSVSFGTSNSTTSASYIQVASNPFANGNRVKYTATGAGVVGLANNDYYYVVSANATHFRLSGTNSETNYKTISNNATTGANASLGIVNGAITSITFTNRGTGYRSIPAVSVNDEAGGTGAVLIASLANEEVTTFGDSFDPGDLAYVRANTNNFIANVAQVVNDYVVNMDAVAPFTTTEGEISKMQVTARATVESVSANQLVLKNVRGIFRQGLKIAGLSSYATATINDGTPITINDKSASGFGVSLQMTSLVGTLQAGYAPLIEDELVYQDSVTPFNQPSGRVHSMISNEGAGNDIVYITREYGTFNVDPNQVREIYSDVSESVFQLLNIYHGDFVRDSGEVLYVENLDPISRSGNKSEIIKIVLEY